MAPVSRFSKSLYSACFRAMTFDIGQFVIGCINELGTPPLVASY